ncbi:hypothetical protein WR25_09003 [Diploscapter pachys]|uniref:ADP/ATP translocase n=1 Tax=Diploscapter pachys TaxID=2018661 RepID=A0A2A2M1S1_9BILA|nr:hypothetical protein WR25_09003 [Diploscapter pachys]
MSNRDSVVTKLVERKDAVRFSKDFVAGAFAAAVAKTVVAPIERVKLVLQLQSGQETIAVDKRYKGMVDCFIRLPKEQSLGFAFINYFKKWFVAGVDPKTNHARFFAGNLTAAATGGVATIIIIYPLEVIRTRLAVDMGKAKTNREFTGIFDCTMKIAKHDGMQGLYRGLVPSIQYIFIYRGFYYGLFDSGKTYFAKDGQRLGFWRAFALGQVVTLVAAYLGYPLDTIRRRLMMNAGKKQMPFKGTIGCAKYILVHEGWKAFFNGALVNALRGWGAALVLALYNETEKLY